MSDRSRPFQEVISRTGLKTYPVNYTRYQPERLPQELVRRDHGPSRTLVIATEPKIHNQTQEP